MLTGHGYTNQSYARDLREIRERLLLMSGRVERIIRESIQCLVNRDGKKRKHHSTRPSDQSG